MVAPNPQIETALAAAEFAGVGSVALLTPPLPVSPTTALEGTSETGSATVWAARVDRLLGPVLPPAMVDAIGAPFALAETLLSALVSSSYALLLPLMLLSLATLSRPFRREAAAMLAGR